MLEEKRLLVIILRSFPPKSSLKVIEEEMKNYNTKREDLEEENQESNERNVIL